MCGCCGGKASLYFSDGAVCLMGRDPLMSTEICLADDPERMAVIERAQVDALTGVVA